MAGDPSQILTKAGARPDAADSVARRLADIRARIAGAAPDPSRVTLVAISMVLRV